MSFLLFGQGEEPCLGGNVLEWELNHNRFRMTGQLYELNEDDLQMGASGATRAALTPSPPFLTLKRASTRNASMGG